MEDGASVRLWGLPPLPQASLATGLTLPGTLVGSGDQALVGRDPAREQSRFPWLRQPRDTHVPSGSPVLLLLPLTTDPCSWKLLRTLHVTVQMSLLPICLSPALQLARLRWGPSTQSLTKHAFLRDTHSEQESVEHKPLSSRDEW